MSEQGLEAFNQEVQHEGLSDKGVPDKRTRLGVLISGSGSNLQAIIDALENGGLPGVEIAVVICNNARAAGLQRALEHKIPAMYLPWRKFPAAAFPRDMNPNEARIASLLQLFQVDLVVLAGWMRIFSAPFLEQFSGRVINIHPALLPERGQGETYTLSNGEQIPVFRGINAVKMALDAGVKTTGSSVHYVTVEVDAGPVICQQEVAIEPEDTEEHLHQRLKTVEHRLIVEAIKKVTGSMGTAFS